MKIFFFLFFSGIVSCWFFPAAYAAEWDLGPDEAVEVALRDNREVLIKAKDVEQARARVSGAKAAFFPTLSATAAWTNTLGFYPKALSSVSTQTTLKHYLYRGGEPANSVRQKTYEVEASEAVLDRTKLEIAFEVQTAYFALAFARVFRHLNYRIAANAQAHLRAAEARYAKGEVPESDMLEIKSTLKNIRSAYLASLHQAEAAQHLLGKLLNLDEDVRVRPQGVLDSSGESFVLEEAFLRAQEERPEIRQYRAEAEAKRLAVEVARSGQRPSVYASWDYYSRSTTSLTFAPSKAWQDYSVAGLTFSWPVFDGWATKAKVEEALAGLQAAELAREHAWRDIVLEIKNDYLDLRDALAKIKAAQAGVAFYKDLFLRTKARYQGGLSNSLELDDALLKYEVAVFNSADAVYDYCIARVRFHKAQGGI